MVTISSGSYDILDSGSVIQFEDKPITFSFDGLSVVFGFESGDSDKTTPNVLYNLSGNILQLTLINFDSTSVTGNAAPTAIGTYDGRELFVSYRVSGFGKLEDNKHMQSRTLHYTFYLGERVDGVESFE